MPDPASQMIGGMLLIGFVWLIVSWRERRKLRQNRGCE